jgi:hypothetical protein
MNKVLKKTPQALGCLAGLLVLGYLALALWITHLFSAGSFDVSGKEASGHCPSYMRGLDANVIRARNSEGMTGGTLTIQLELPSAKFDEFLAGSPFRNSALQSHYVPLEFKHWLPWGRYKALGRSKAFSSGSLSKDRHYHSILVDRTSASKYVVYMSSGT